MVKPLTHAEINKIDQMIGLLSTVKIILKSVANGNIPSVHTYFVLKSIELRLRTRNQ